MPFQLKKIRNWNSQLQLTMQLFMFSEIKIPQNWSQTLRWTHQFYPKISTRFFTSSKLNCAEWSWFWFECSNVWIRWYGFHCVYISLWIWLLVVCVCIRYDLYDKVRPKLSALLLFQWACLKRMIHHILLWRSPLILGAGSWYWSWLWRMD